jgi:peptidoglycan hydrolase CwlO-like protein
MSGASEQLAILQQQLKALKDGQARLNHDIAALQANSPSASSSAAGEQSQAGQQRPASNSPTASGDTPVVSGASASNSPDAPGANSSEGGAVSPAAEGRATGSSPGTDAGKFGQRLDDLSKEVSL